jgi:hypothetical protein
VGMVVEGKWKFCWREEVSRVRLTQLPERCRAVSVFDSMR